MQIFFALSYSGINGNKWSQKKFHEIVTSYIKSCEGVTIEDLKDTTGWNLYKCLIPVADQEEALNIRKTVEKLCKDVNHKCRPFYFRFRNKDVEKVSDLSMFGLNVEETKIFVEKSPPGTYRDISV